MLGELAEVDRGDVAVLVLGEDREVEDPDDAPFDEIEDDRCGLAAGRIVGPFDQHVVDRSHSLEFTGFHRALLSMITATTYPARPGNRHPIDVKSGSQGSRRQG